MKINILLALFGFFALLGPDKVVRQVISADQKFIDAHPAEMFPVNVKRDACGAGCAWQETSTDGSVGKNFAGIGFVYDSTRSGFVEQKKSDKNSWTVDAQTLKLKPPKPYPAGCIDCGWDEAKQVWYDRDAVKVKEK